MLKNDSLDTDTVEIGAGIRGCDVGVTGETSLTNQIVLKQGKPAGKV
jgi:hypothetical protein